MSGNNSCIRAVVRFCCLILVIWQVTNPNIYANGFYIENPQPDSREDMLEMMLLNGAPLGAMTKFINDVPETDPSHENNLVDFIGKQPQRKRTMKLLNRETSEKRAGYGSACLFKLCPGIY